MHKSLNFFICLALQMGYGSMLAQSPIDNTLKHYKVTQFRTSDGLPGNSLLSVKQDSAGLLWVGGFEGLTRFDGTRFVVFNSQNTPELKSTQITALNVDGSGTLWIGTGRGLVKYSKGHFTDLSTPEFSFYIECMALDEKHGALWLGTRNSGLFKYDIRTKNYTQLENKFSHDIITSIVTENENNIWISSEKNGVAHYENGKWTHLTKSDGLPSNEITWLLLQNENLYIGTILGLCSLHNNKIESVPQLSDSRITKMNIDAGNLWVLTTTGVHVIYKNGMHQTITRENGLSANDIRDICFDSDGSAWLATYRGGLNQLHEEKFTTLTNKEGLEAEAVTSLYELEAGKLIAGTSDGKLFTIENRKAKAFPIKYQINKPICEILKDHLGNLWFATYDGLLLCRPDGQQQLFTEADGLPTRQLRSIVQTADKTYWIGSRTSGIIKMIYDATLRKPVFTKVFEEQLAKANATFVISMTVSGNNELLVASSSGNVLKVSSDGVSKQYRVVKPGSTEVVFSARVDRDGVIWAASANGLSRVKNDSVYVFSKAQGLPQETIYDAIEDDSGNLWMPTTKGIIKARKSELDAYIKNSSARILWRMYDKNDDLIQSECTGASRVLKDSKGQLWFPMVESVVMVDPAKVSPGSRPPGIAINGMFANDQTIALQQGLVLQPGANRLVISFGAISLKYQKAVHYRYKLENFDPAWIESESDMQAVYTSLPPGKYIFRVTACNKDDVCNAEGASLSFSIEPYFYQTRWFWIIVSLMLAASVYTYVRLRTRSIRHRAFELQKLVEIRTREIAAQRDELVVLNEELQASEEEVMAQRDTLAEKNEHIEKMNANLEKIVAERTLALEQRNLKLEEYAFINAHKLRGPLARILGIIHLLETETDKELQKKMLELLLIASNDLDAVIHSINKMLEEVTDKG